MFNKKLIAHLETEIARLSEQNRDLLDRLMAFFAAEHARHLTKDLVAQPVEPPSYTDMVTGNLVSMKAETEEEKQQKEKAMGQFLKVMGGEGY